MYLFLVGLASDFYLYVQSFSLTHALITYISAIKEIKRKIKEKEKKLLMLELTNEIGGKIRLIGWLKRIKESKSCDL